MSATQSWEELVSALSDWLTNQPLGVFDSPQVMVPSGGVRKLVNQALAASSPHHIAAGIHYVTPRSWLRLVTEQCQLSETWELWRPEALGPLAHKELLAMAEEPQWALIRENLLTDKKARLGTHAAELLSRYLEHAWPTLRRWAEEENVDAEGHALPTHQLWQPELYRRLLNSTATDPADAVERLVAESHQLPAMAVLGIHGQPPLIEALLAGQPSITRWELPTGDPDAPAKLTVFPGRGEFDQVRRLRDGLCDVFQNNPSLEPRDVVIVADDPASWSAALFTGFHPLDPQLKDHPGRRLRVEVNPAIPNAALAVLCDLLRLPDRRATGNDLLRLLSHPLIGQRWQLDADQLAELVEATGIRWGIDEQHRASFGLPGLSQNTWVRGIDRLLASVVADDADVRLPVLGTPGISSSQVGQLGRLAELLSRVRKLLFEAREAATITQWASRSVEALNAIAGASAVDPWVVSDALHILGELPRFDAGVAMDRQQYLAWLERHSLPRRRPTLGNGSIAVVPPGDALPGPYKVVCLLGLDDHTRAHLPDELPMGTADEALLRHKRLVAHCQSAAHVLVTYRAFTPTDAPVKPPQILTLLRSRFPHVSETTPPRYLPAPQHLERPSTSPQRRTPAPAEPARTVGQLSRFLRDPAKRYLAAAGNVRIISQPEIADGLPLEVSPLAKWKLRDTVLELLREGASIDDAVQHCLRLELVMQNPSGQSTVLKHAREARALWRQAEPAWQPCKFSQAAYGPLRARVPLRAGQVVTVSASTSDGVLVEPWIQVLLLAASGQPAPARVYSLAKAGRYQTQPRCRVLQPPDVSQAEEHLDALQRVYSVGHDRLVPLPQDAAFEFLAKSSSPEAWDRYPDEYQAVWRFRSPEWKLFFPGAASDLFTTTVHDDDPVDPDYGAFGGWAELVYGPMLRAVKAGA